ncbi:LysR family transcriptional regulator [Paraburkholderia sp. RCC_158]|uniref:LysR family transcriptional regulator n=1 Tax=Paraburkholderia sp. RCC_158 TaxID=3239220 RepID=UPI00352468C6
MNQLQAMRVFSRVVELASFNLAARQLGVSPAAVTRSIGMLEAHLNTRLLNRTTRTLSLTEAGREYLCGCRTIIEQLDEMEASLVQSTRQLRGTLHVASVATFVQSGLAPLLAAYRTLHEGVSFEVTTFDVRIDMVEGGFDVCFSDNPALFGSTLVCRPLLRVPQVLVASPTYLSIHDRPHAPSTLGRHTLLCRSESGQRCWEFVDRTGGHRVSVDGALLSPSYAMLKAAALQDMGIAMLPRPMVEAELQRGALVHVLEDFDVSAGQEHLSILYSSPGQLSMKVRSFVDFVVDKYRSAKPPAALRAVT